MLKTAGLALVGAASVYAALISSGRLRERARICAELRLALAVLRVEICQRLSPLGEALKAPLPGAGRKTAEFLSRCALKLSENEDGFAALWKQAAGECFGDALKSAELDALREVGGFLGRCRADEQERVLKRAEDAFGEFEALARREAYTTGRIRAVVSLCAGVVAVVLLM